jgi:hypothetical protein
VDVSSLTSSTDFIIVPSHRLLICKQSKVASTQLRLLFGALGRAEGLKPAYLVNPSLPRLKGILANRSWHKAVFFREPLERFLSAFLSKCQRGPLRDRDGPQKCRAAFGFSEMALEDAVALLETGAPLLEKHYTAQVFVSVSVCL